MPLPNRSENALAMNSLTIQQMTWDVKLRAMEALWDSLHQDEIRVVSPAWHESELKPNANCCAEIPMQVFGYQRLLSKRIPSAVYYRLPNETCLIFRVLDCR